MRLPQKPPNYRDTLPALINRSGDDLAAFLAEIVRDSPSKYHHWDDLRRRTPPANVSVKEWWAALKLARAAQRIELPLRAKTGNACSFVLHPEIVETCHRLDERMTDDYSLVPDDQHERYSVASMLDESTMSSILEGAATRREEAVTMLRTGRRPTTTGEKMVTDNYHAMNYVHHIADDALTPEHVLELHRVATEDTLGPDEAGRFRRADESVRVYDEENRVLHDPPDADELPERLTAMCAFANGKSPGVFIHRVIRAILLHYWLAYDHPFVDGNGRTARALFYWCMLHHGFTPIQYVSISTVLVASPTKYARSYQLCQSDDDDLTYFINHQLDAIERAFAELDKTVCKQSQEMHQVQEALDRSGELNHRQHALLSHAVRHPGFWYTIQSHRRSHAVAYETAREDLLQLAERKLLHKTKRGKAFHFQAPRDLRERVRTAG